MTTVAYLLPNTDLHGGNRVPIDQAEELVRRGYDVEIWSPSGPPDWHQSSVRFVQADIFAGALPRPDICIATFWPTVAPACATGAGRVFHLCQGFEGVHQEYASLLPSIDDAYRMPTVKLVVSPHLVGILRRRYGIEAHLVGTGIDLETFRPAPERDSPHVLRIGVVGAYDLRPKGVREVVRGLRLARDLGMSFELWRVSSSGFTPEENALNPDARCFERLSTQQMAEFYRSVDCLVHGSWNEEGFGLPPLEAGACGCAVAATDIDPMAAFSSGAILRFPPARQEVIPDVMRQLADVAARRLLRSRFLAEVGKFDIRKVVDRLEAAFHLD